MLPLEAVKCVSPDAELWPTLELMDREGIGCGFVTGLGRETVAQPIGQ